MAENSSAETVPGGGASATAPSPQKTGPPVAAAGEELIFLFSSVPPNRPNYKRGVLNALCYPNGQTFDVSYKLSDVQPELRQKLGSLVGKRALFVFVDYRGAGDIFVPVRYAKILSCGPQEPTQQPQQMSERTRIYIRLELGAMVKLDTRWDQRIKEIPNSPKPYVADEPRTHRFVLQSQGLAEKSDRDSQADIWDELVERISEATVLSDCIFLKTTSVQEFTGGSDCLFHVFGETQKAYRLRPNHLYKMDLRIFDRRNKPDTNQEIFISSSSDLITVSQPFATAVGGPVEHTVLIVCKRSIENTLATLVMDVRDSATAAAPALDGGAGAAKKDAQGKLLEGPKTVETAPGSVICAKPRYLLYVSVAKATLFWFLLFVFLGVVLSGMSVEFFKDTKDLFDWLPGTPAEWGLATKIIGAIFLAGAAFLGFRKLPSGSPGG
jgi:hypothetical protein